ncbi:hypothetical protein [Sandaracinus amylolyticus]|uniref:Uncharacterized protein n=1 Tax=Sandaracinus amylolyticus TaxID=927083 RepID=A0A0F6W187_9BACT|nr:hypothetical protein [Sandaracinus amylolyticus]AKF04823.1 hypothetical protein DB32_001972 [Sandaracinus amylolyticus]
MIWRALLDRARGRIRIGEDLAYLVPDAAYAARMQKPDAPVWGPVEIGPCRCGRAFEERVITSALPSDDADDDAWERAPVAVDGWVCEPCGVLRYPRPMTPDQITALGHRGAALAREGRPREAEWWFTRITWDWPTWVAGYLDLAQALRARAAREQDPARVAKLRESAREAYVAAFRAASGEPPEEAARMTAIARIALAEIAVEERAFARARDALDACRNLALAPEQRARVDEITAYLDEERHVFGDAAAMLRPYMRLQGEAHRAIEPAARSRIVAAVATLEAYAAAHPAHWQSKWMAAKGSAALDEARAIELWRAAWRAHPDVGDIVREHALALLERDLVDEALAVNRDATARLPADSKLWCNRAVCEVLAGDLRGARASVAESRRLDPADPIARALEARLASLGSERPAAAHARGARGAASLIGSRRRGRREKKPTRVARAGLSTITSSASPACRPWAAACAPCAPPPSPSSRSSSAERSGSAASGTCRPSMISPPWRAADGTAHHAREALRSARSRAWPRGVAS